MIVTEYPDKALTVRIPVIPGYNDSDENILNTARFVRHLRGDHKIELLPYHKLGIAKYKALSREYPLPSVESPLADHMRTLEDLVESYGIQARIGG